MQCESSVSVGGMGRVLFYVVFTKYCPVMQMRAGVGVSTCPAKVQKVCDDSFAICFGRITLQSQTVFRRNSTKDIGSGLPGPK